MFETILLFRPQSTNLWADKLDNLLQQVRTTLVSMSGDVSYSNFAQTNLIWTRIFLSDAANQIDSLKAHPLYQEVLAKGSVSYVEQQPLSGCKIALLMGISPKAAIRRQGEAGQMMFENEGKRFFFHSVKLTDEEVGSLTPREQTILCFQKHQDWLQQNGLSVRDHCLRTWLYVRDIDHNYAGVVQGRNEFFHEIGLTASTHFIASTGIEGKAESTKAVVCIDFFSTDAINDGIQYLHAPKYLNPTHEYGVAFERGTAWTMPEGSKLFISGTASIDKYGKCIWQGDVVRQAERLVTNIEQLLADGKGKLSDLQFLLIYLRDISDYSVINAYFKERFPSLPVLITLAPVCRPQWLIEAEGIAFVQEDSK